MARLVLDDTKNFKDCKMHNIYYGCKRIRIKNSVWFFLRRKMHNRRYVVVFNWRKAMWQT